MTGNFYKHIYRAGDNFRIIKNGVHYGWFDNVRDALYERDRLIECDWDLVEWVYLEETHNPYSDIILPPFDSNIKHLKQYISFDSINNVWKIRKSINGKQKNFGNFIKLNDALKRRNELIECDWEC